MSPAAMTAGLRFYNDHPEDTSTSFRRRGSPVWRSYSFADHWACAVGHTWDRPGQHWRSQ